MKRAGQLRHKGQILIREEVSASGAPATGACRLLWDNIFAEIDSTSGRTTDNQGIERERVSATITIRHRDGITQRMIFRHLQGRGLDPIDYNISAVLPDGRRRFMELECVRREKPVALA